MENLLRLVENLHPQIIDEDRLKFFTLKILIWDHFSMLQTRYQSLSVEKKLPYLRGITPS